MNQQKILHSLIRFLKTIHLNKIGKTLERLKTFCLEFLRYFKCLISFSSISMYDNIELRCSFDIQTLGLSKSNCL